MAATIIEDDIRSKVYDVTNYPKFDDMANGDLLPETLSRLLAGVIKTKSNSPKPAERRRKAIAHSIISAARPRSFISPILLAIAVYVNLKLESRELVDVLSSLSFADDYREVARFHDALMPNEKEKFDLKGDVLNFVFDNADIDVRTLTGHNTWHTLGGIVAGTPTIDRDVEPVIPRSTQIRCSDYVGQFSQISMHKYKKISGTGLKKCFIGPLKPPIPLPPTLHMAKSLDNVWLTSFALLLPLSIKCPNWTGFMETAVRGNKHDRSSITILPFVNLDTTKLDTLYSALIFAQKQIENHQKLSEGLQDARQIKIIGAVTFDQPLFAKADDIVQASPEIARIFVRLGGFHLIMSYLGSIGFIMRGSGIETLLGTVYAQNTVDHMISGHAYARALRGHFLVCAALNALMLEENIDCLTDINLSQFRNVYNSLFDVSSETISIVNESVVTKLSQTLDKISANLSSQNRTGKLWINYLRHINILRLFIYG